MLDAGSPAATHLPASATVAPRRGAAELTFSTRFCATASRSAPGSASRSIASRRPGKSEPNRAPSPCSKSSLTPRPFATWTASVPAVRGRRAAGRGSRSGRAAGRPGSGGSGRRRSRRRCRLRRRGRRAGRSRTGRRRRASATRGDDDPRPVGARLGEAVEDPDEHVLQATCRRRRCRRAARPRRASAARRRCRARPGRSPARLRSRARRSASSAARSNPSGVFPFPARKSVLTRHQHSSQ